ncbi:MAG: hypothetical protein WBH28_02620 [Fuerstiella sp.]
MLAHFDRIQLVHKAYQSASKKWQGCDWYTEFGALKLNLCGLTAAQAFRVSRATCGNESREWALAGKWLQSVEDAAAHAENLASQAMSAILADNLLLAAEFIEKAVEVEAVWHETPVWGELRAVILCEKCSHELTRF